MTGYGHQNQWYQLADILTIIFLQKVKFTPHLFFWDIAKILQTCYFRYFWLTKRILDRNLRTQILLDKGFAIKSK